MSTVNLSGLRPTVVSALRRISGMTHMQNVIALDGGVCTIDWNPKARIHHTMMLPLVLTTAAVDEGAAGARWRGISLVDLVSAATGLDGNQKDIIVALAGAEDDLPFGDTVISWSDRFGLEEAAITINRALASARPHHGHYAIRPIKPLGQMPKALKPLPVVSQMAAVSIFALYNASDAQAAFRGKRMSAMNPPAVEALRTIRDEAGDDGHAHLLRMIAAYPGW